MRSGVASLAVDLYEVAAEDAALVISLHGGAWVMGGRRDHIERLTALQDRGIAVASVDYRLASEAPHPAQREDIEAVVAHLRRGGSRAPIFLMGASAGAHLGALAAFSSPRLYSGFIGLFGRYDLTATGRALRPARGLPVPDEIASAAGSTEAASALGHEERIAMLAGVPVAQLDEERLAQMSPVMLLRADAPPLFLAHGTADAVVDHRHSELLARRALELGIRCRLMLVPGANHEDELFAGAPVMDAIADFIQSVEPERN